MAEIGACPLIVEAVFEEPKVKLEVFQQLAPHLADDTIVATNTSTIPVTGLATAVKRQERFVGIHFSIQRRLWNWWRSSAATTRRRRRWM